ncbi:hypothetical protein ACFLT5_03755 [Chloroflexota bacterium]
MAARRPGKHWLAWAGGLLLAVVLLVAALVLTRPLWSDLLFSVTGEELLPAQVRGGLEWLGNVTRRQPNTEDFVPVANAGVPPFGVNAFLQQEVESQKRERAVEMIADAGFHWIRQEFPWEDIEIHGKGDFEDRRHEPYRSAWAKYDHIVDLADQYDLEIIVRLSNPPSWSRAQGNDAGSLAPPDDLADYGDFVEAVVRRYKGRIRYYQIWNEPNLYPEWGERPVSPEEYTALLKEGHTRVKAACPDCVVLSGALAQTIPLGPRDLNDFIFLQRMYDAGAADYFDVLSMQGYGLWSGPTDRRMRPRVLNFSRPLYLREIMVKNGDAGKPIWMTEMNWNASPPDLPDHPFGYVTLEQQARYAVLAYERAQREWPWLGVVNTWFFKRATDLEQDQAMYYFRLVEPDFTAMPVYDALTEYMHQTPTLYPGIHQEDHWALSYSGPWERRVDSSAELGAYQYTDSSGSALDFQFEGSDLVLKMGPGVDGVLAYQVDGGSHQNLEFHQGDQIQLARALPAGRHTISIQPAPGPLAVDSVTVRQGAAFGPWLIAGGALVLTLGAVALIAGAAARRRQWYQRGRS